MARSKKSKVVLRPASDPLEVVWTIRVSREIADGVDALRGDMERVEWIRAHFLAAIRDPVHEVERHMKRLGVTHDMLLRKR